MAASLTARPIIKPKLSHDVAAKKLVKKITHSPKVYQTAADI